MDGFLLELRRNTPEYLKAYEDGYEQAKRDMADVLEKMQALQTETTTTVKGFIF